MKEVPLLFKRDMVRAIIGRRKQVTRRLFKRADIGDRIWVRETYAGPFDGEYVYRADWDEADIRLEQVMTAEFPHIADAYGSRWRPSLFMPKKAARIWLEVIDVRRHRLQDMVCADAQREGFGFGSEGMKRFRKYWDALHANRQATWAANPMVFAHEFRRIDV